MNARSVLLFAGLVPLVSVCCNNLKTPPISTTAPAGSPATTSASGNQAAQVATQTGAITGVSMESMKQVEMGLLLAVLLAALLILVGFIQWLQYRLQSKRIDAVYSRKDA